MERKACIIRQFLEQLPFSERLCDEVLYILKTKINVSEIEISHLTSRAKDLSSFCNKIDRKKYSDPFKEITDFSVVRLVYLYESDKSLIEKIIESEFQILEKVDKLNSQDVDKFGYGALHYIVSLKNQHTGARYEGLKEICCEIQGRTILQDAWAVVAHHLSYKNEANVPVELRRKLNALAGLFETADDQFEMINVERKAYRNKVMADISVNTVSSLDVNVNLDSLLGYMSLKYPDRKSSSNDAVVDLIEEIKPFGYRTLKSIDDAVKSSWEKVLKEELEDPPTDQESGESTEYLHIGMIRTALTYDNEAYSAFIKRVD